MKCPHCAWDSPGSERCELCGKSLLTGPARSAPALGVRLDFRETAEAGESLSELLRRELWRVLDGRSSHELALTALAQFWTSLEPFLEKLASTAPGRQADESLRLSHERLLRVLENWPAEADPPGLRAAVAGLDQSLELLARCRKS